MRRRVTRWAAGLAALLAVPIVLSGCSIRTAGGPKGGLTLYATFDDAQNLVTGHSVQMADVKVGTVTEVRLDRKAYRAKVTMSIKDDYKIPEGTSAEVAVTSLLGENYVRLTLPQGRSMTDGRQMLADNAVIAKTSMQPQFEQVVGQAGPLLDALAGDDVAAVVDAGATALGGNGRKLNTMVAQSGDLIKVFADQRAELAASVDRLATLGKSLGKGSSELDRAPGELEKTTRVLNENKEKLLATVERLTRMARLLNDKVLENRVQKMKTLIRKLDPVLAQLGGDRQRLTQVIKGLVQFSDRLPMATYDGQLLLYPLLRFIDDKGNTFPTSTGLTPASAGLAPVKLPQGIDTALPKIDKVVGGGR